MKALVGTFNQEKALVGAFSVIVQPVVVPMDRFAALVTSDSVSDCSTGDDRSLGPGPGRSGGARHGAVPHRAQRCPGEVLLSATSHHTVFILGLHDSH